MLLLRLPAWLALLLPRGKCDIHIGSSSFWTSSRGRHPSPTGDKIGRDEIALMPGALLVSWRQKLKIKREYKWTSDTGLCVKPPPHPDDIDVVLT